MNEYLADILAQHYINMPFITKSSGIVKTFLKPQKKGKALKIPVANRCFTSTLTATEFPELGSNGVNEIVCNSSSDFYAMQPSSEQLGILYFEDLGADKVSSDRRYTTWKGSLKLVCWLNMKKIGVDNKVSTLSLAVASNTPFLIVPSGTFLGGTLEAVKHYPKTPNPFQKYDYDETQTQFITNPYDYFSIKLDFLVRTVNGWACPDLIRIQPSAC